MTARHGARPSILVVDDVPENLDLMTELLRADYRVRVANSGARAIRVAASDPRPDLILLDIMMPDVDGYRVCEQLKQHPRTRDIPVVFLTAMSEVVDEARGLELGAVDYITKPISPPVLLARVRTHLTLKAAADFLRDRSAYLQAEVDRRSREVLDIQEVTILALASLAEIRDLGTGLHIRRTQHYVRALAEHLRRRSSRHAHLSDRDVDLLFRSAALHDIGKVGIPDRILLKAGRLDPDEFETMKTHTTMGYEAIALTERMLGAEVPFLKFAKEIALSHQEKWDGTGYPQGLAGEAIPFSARLMALVDVYDALISRRPYKPPYTHDDAVRMIVGARGLHFDPEITDAFVEIADLFRAIAEQFAGDDDVPPLHGRTPSADPAAD